MARRTYPASTPKMLCDTCNGSRATAWLAVAAILAAVWLPPEHVHEVQNHGEHSEVVHRHLAAHHHSESGAALDHQDGDARYLSSPFTIPDASKATPVRPVAVSVLAFTPPHLERGWRLEPLHVRVHDPPWARAVGPRAPPSSARHT